VVSNHGARQLDYVPATVDALPQIVAAVGQQIDVFVDGGVTQGTDVLKCLALGAKCVFVGRPALWGLAWKGQVIFFNFLFLKIKNIYNNNNIILVIIYHYFSRD